MDSAFLFLLGTLVAGVLLALVLRRHFDARERRRELSRQKTIELREKHWAEQMEASRERMRREQLQRASKRDLQRMANEEAGQRLRDIGLAPASDRQPRQPRVADTSIPGQPLYDGSAHALAAGEVPRSVSGLSSWSPSCSSDSSSDGASADSGSCGGGD